MHYFKSVGMCSGTLSVCRLFNLRKALSYFVIFLFAILSKVSLFIVALDYSLFCKFCYCDNIHSQNTSRLTVTHIST